ncbi:MAG: hypothetical protein NC928_01320 [Candidatus Omnitrophica bacterium]|nr:hypothetical protein [Candidatus Omnitrophota bacterium]
MKYCNRLRKRHLFLALVSGLFLFISNLYSEEISQNLPVQSSPQTASQPQPREPQIQPQTELQPPAGSAAEDTASVPQRFVGELFGVPVPEGNYFVVNAAITVFGNRFGPQPKTAEEKENCIWDQLLLSYEAFRRGINVPEEEVRQEVEKILKQEKVQFEYKTDKEAYEKWVREKINVSSTLFENMIWHLLQIEKLRQQVMESVEPAVSEKEAIEEFIKEYNTLSVELIRFDEKKEAEKFYKSARRNAKLWEEQKAKRPDEFKRPGFVSCEFLIDIWKFPKEDCTMMMKEKIGSIYKPFPIYKGFAVAKILEKRPAEKKEFKKVKDSYYEQIKRRKRYEILGKWFEDLKQQAKIKIYPATTNSSADVLVKERKEEAKNE